MNKTQIMCPLVFIMLAIIGILSLGGLTSYTTGLSFGEACISWIVIITIAVFS